MKLNHALAFRVETPLAGQATNAVVSGYLWLVIM